MNMDLRKIRKDIYKLELPKPLKMILITLMRKTHYAIKNVDWNNKDLAHLRTELINTQIKLLNLSIVTYVLLLLVAIIFLFLFLGD